MFISKRSFLNCMLGILAIWLPIKTQAGGICLYEISSANTRLASAGWSARADDPSTVFTNPAGMTRLCGPQLEANGEAIFGRVRFEPNSKTHVRGSTGRANIWLPSGSFFYTHPCKENLTLGIGSLGYFGSDLVYNHGWVGRYYVQKALLEGLSLVPAAAYKINKHWSVGAGVNIMYGFMKQRAAVHNVLDNQRDGYFNLHDCHYGFGGVFGILYEPCCTTRFGVQYLSQVRLSFHAIPKFSNIGPILREFLIDKGIIGSSINLHINVPQTFMFSVYHELNPCWTIMCNIGWQEWSNFERVTVSLADLNNTTISSKIKYQDTWHGAIGIEWHYTRNITLSSGLAYDSSAISTKQRPLDFPIGSQWRFGSGARWNIRENLILDLSSEFQWVGNLKANVNKPIAGRVSGTFKNTYVFFMSSGIKYLF